MRKNAGGTPRPALVLGDAGGREGFPYRVHEPFLATTPRPTLSRVRRGGWGWGFPAAVAASSVARSGAAAGGETAIEITMETRGPDHIAEIISALSAAGYAQERVL